MQIDFEIISTVILRLSVESFKKDGYQLQAKVYARGTCQLLVQAKEKVCCPAMTIAVGLGRKATKQTNRPKCSVTRPTRNT